MVDRVLWLRDRGGERLQIVTMSKRRFSSGAAMVMVAVMTLVAPNTADATGSISSGRRRVQSVGHMGPTVQGTPAVILSSIVTTPKAVVRRFMRHRGREQVNRLVLHELCFCTCHHQRARWRRRDVVKVLGIQPFPQESVHSNLCFAVPLVFRQSPSGELMRQIVLGLSNGSQTRRR